MRGRRRLTLVGDPLGTVLAGVVTDQPPPPDLSVTVLPRASGPAVAAVLGFTAHHVVVADVDPEWVHSVLPPDSLSARMGPAVLSALAEKVDAEPGALDLVMLAPAGAEPVPPRAAIWPVDPNRPAWAGHPRLDRSRRYREDVRAWRSDDGGLIALGRGLGGRMEVSIEVEPDCRGRGVGRRLAAAATGLVPPNVPLWAQVAPGNVASVRAFLAAGYGPVCAEVLFI
jgi:GNAT superfamily N-acetyltransferase